MSSVRINLTKAEIGVMLDVLTHIKDHNSWMVEVFDNGEKIENIYTKVVKAYTKLEQEQEKN